MPAGLEPARAASARRRTSGWRRGSNRCGRPLAGSAMRVDVVRARSTAVVEAVEAVEAGAVAAYLDQPRPQALRRRRDGHRQFVPPISAQHLGPTSVVPRCPERSCPPFGPDTRPRLWRAGAAARTPRVRVSRWRGPRDREAPPRSDLLAATPRPGGERRGPLRQLALPVGLRAARNAPAAGV